jgi:hypothetical protein
MTLSRPQMRKMLKDNPDLKFDGIDENDLQGSDLEARFLELWKRYDGPELAREVEFHPVRGWKFDFLHIPTAIAFEIEGIGGKRSRHTSFKGYKEDALKYSEAALMGYKVIRLVTGFTDEEVMNYVSRLKQLIQ